MKPAAMNRPPNENDAETLSRVLREECPESLLGEVLAQCLTATTISRSGAVCPDFRTRLAACQVALSYTHGLPTRREESVGMNVEAEQSDKLEERLQRSPALRRALFDLLGRIEKPTIAV